MKNYIQQLESLLESKNQKAVASAGKMSQVDPSIAKMIVISGTKDNNAKDDKIAVRSATISASKLKPSQTSMVLEKALGMALFMLKSGKIGGDLGAIISSDNHIMDGHHRWAATILASGNRS